MQFENKVMIIDFKNKKLEKAIGSSQTSLVN